MPLLVSVENKIYPIWIESTFAFNPNFYSFIKDRNVFVISDENVAFLHFSDLIKILKKTVNKVESMVLPAGEKTKSLFYAEKIWEKLLDLKYDRNCLIIAFGGGVIGDLSGFIAACYLRGVNFIQIPTSLLAQVDSSIGGKTAINHSLGKNMIGAFYHPNAVFISIDYLKTLPNRDFSAGMSEIIKCAIIESEDFFDWIVENQLKILQKDENTMKTCIFRCCEIKKKLVEADEKEQKNIRILLNLGHTFAHAIESEYKYETYLHGEAVSIGIIMAANLSYLLGFLSLNDIEKIKKVFRQFNLPIEKPKNMSVDAFFSYMFRDKKTINQKLRFILPVSIGKVQLFEQIDHEIVKQAILMTN